MSGSARDEILGRIKAATAATRDSDPLSVWSKDRPASIRPQLPGDVESSFRAKAATNLINIRDVGGIEGVPVAVAEILARANLAPDISVSPTLRDLPWPRTVQVRDEKARVDEKLTVTRAVAGIAETGSVVLCSSKDAPSSLNYAPEIHVIVLDKADITAFLEDGLAKVKAAYDPWPRAVNL
ncbi:MAG: LUD domain-containing protein, partial [Hyphomicrobiaceae bacterium]|nr:LUD domain-containing protein [Hyphomicrobiaceae bacterium]